MASIRRLNDLSALASAALPPQDAVQQALPLLREGLGASEAFLVYGGDGTFRCFGTCAEINLSDIALWLVHRDLTTRREPCAFDLRDGHVVDLRSASERQPCFHLAAEIPMPNSAGEMLVVRGHWPRGLSLSQTTFLSAALPTLALLLERQLDAARAQRQHSQLSALANITRVMSDSDDLETVLCSIAATIATVAGVDYVSIDLVEQDGAVALRCTNLRRPGAEQLEERWKRGANKPDPVRDLVLRSHQGISFPDAQNDERIPESGRAFFTQALIRSTAVFPLLAKDEALGVVSIASHRPLVFAADELELFEGLAAQVATAVKGIRLYRELAESREELRHLNDQLQERMSIQHHLARTDALTGVPNRRFIDETVDAECSRARRYGQPLSVVMADLDRFKEINDRFGHVVGDDALRFVARLAREACRQVDIVGRYGGDEFIFVLPSTQLEEAASFAERFRRTLAETVVPIEVTQPVHLTVSTGVAQWDSDTMDGPARLVAQADGAMYQAKAAGRNQTKLSVEGKLAIN
jgi:diguanylate cyclase (GGDEF)-like protein